MSLNKISGNGNFPQDINTQNSDLKRVYIKSLHENKRDEVSFSGKSADKKPQKYPIIELLKKGGIIKPPETPEEKYNKEILKKIKMLQKQGYLTRIKSDNTEQHLRINPRLAEDVEKMYLYTNGKKSEKELFTPNFKNADEAEKSLNTGDTCIIGDEKNISIKTREGKIKPLNMSPELYFKLFSPGHRYSFCQQNSGDCYLVTSLYAMSANPGTREIILSCFNEKPDGTVDVKFPKGKTTFNLDLYGYNNQYSPEDQIVSSCEGIKALEFAYGKDIAKESIELNQQDIAKSQKGINETKEYYKNIIQWKISQIEKKMSEDGEISIDDLTSIHCALEDGDEILGWMKRVTLKDFSDYLEATDKEDVYKIDPKKFNEQKTKEYMQEIKVYQNVIDTCNKTSESDIANQKRGNGGLMGDVFKKFGLSSKIVFTSNSSKEDIEQLKKDLDKTDGSMIFIASTGNDIEKGNFWTGKHAYIVNPEKSSNGEIIYRVTNPWNTSFSLNVTKEELFKKFCYFDTINVK